MKTREVPSPMQQVSSLFYKAKTGPDPLPVPVTPQAGDGDTPTGAAKSLHGGWALEGHTLQTAASLGCPKGTMGDPTSHPFPRHPTSCSPSHPRPHPTVLHPSSSTEAGPAASPMPAGALLGAPSRASSCMADAEPSRAGRPSPQGRGPCRVRGSPAYRQQCGSSLLPLLVARPPGTLGAAGSQGPLISHMTPGVRPELCREGSRESHWRTLDEPKRLALPSPTIGLQHGQAPQFLPQSLSWSQGSC